MVQLRRPCPLDSIRRIETRIPPILWILAELPGYYTNLVAQLAKRMAAQGVPSVFVAASPYYELLRRVDLSALGPVHYVSKALAVAGDQQGLDEEAVDLWLTHATFVRQRHFWGRHLNPWDHYRRLARFYRQLFTERGPFSVVVSANVSNAVIAF